MKMSTTVLTEVLESHRKWLAGDPTGLRANLSEADLSRANLSGANLWGANLSEANLSEADLSRANLSGAKLWGASLSRANLSGANLWGANLSEADLLRASLSGADLWGANLWGANLSEANLSRANLSGANLSRVWGLAFQIPQEGELIVYKKLSDGTIAKLRVPPNARRTATPVGRKCRAEFVEVLEGSGVSQYDRGTVYEPGLTIWPDAYNDDSRVECTSGIHFFLTREEAEAY